MVLSCWCGQPPHADYTNHQGGSNESIKLVLGYSGAFSPGDFIGHKQFAYDRYAARHSVCPEELWCAGQLCDHHERSNRLDSSYAIAHGKSSSKR
jgi:hypothetical protein